MTETPNPNIDPDTLTGEMRPIRPAVLSIGSNVGDRAANLQGAIEALADTPDVRLVTVSSVYETTPIDAPDGSPDFLNAVLLVDTTLSVAMLLDRAKAVESAFGRERGEVNAPRTLDVDDELLAVSPLEVEHPVVADGTQATKHEPVCRPLLRVRHDASPSWGSAGSGSGVESTGEEWWIHNRQCPAVRRKTLVATALPPANTPTGVSAVADSTFSVHVTEASSSTTEASTSVRKNWR
jgi:2-amino-4-hydroxy-6-hydroxymethyldihydropteridine diphosphokinase